MNIAREVYFSLDEIIRSDQQLLDEMADYRLTIFPWPDRMIKLLNELREQNRMVDLAKLYEFASTFNRCLITRIDENDVLLPYIQGSLSSCSCYYYSVAGMDKQASLLAKYTIEWIQSMLSGLAVSDIHQSIYTELYADLMQFTDQSEAHVTYIKAMKQFETCADDEIGETSDFFWEWCSTEYRLTIKHLFSHAPDGIDFDHYLERIPFKQRLLSERRALQVSE